jgi:hypothetical protein
LLVAVAGPVVLDGHQVAGLRFNVLMVRMQSGVSVNRMHRCPVMGSRTRMDSGIRPRIVRHQSRRVSSSGGRRRRHHVLHFMSVLFPVMLLHWRAGPVTSSALITSATTLCGIDQVHSDSGAAAAAGCLLLLL